MVEQVAAQPERRSSPPSARAKARLRSNPTSPVSAPPISCKCQAIHNLLSQKATPSSGGERSFDRHSPHPLLPLYLHRTPSCSTTDSHALALCRSSPTAPRCPPTGRRTLTPMFSTTSTPAPPRAMRRLCSRCADVRPLHHHPRPIKLVSACCASRLMCAQVLVAGDAATVAASQLPDGTCRTCQLQISHYVRLDAQGEAVFSQEDALSRAITSNICHSLVPALKPVPAPEASPAAESAYPHRHDPACPLPLLSEPPMWHPGYPLVPPAGASLPSLPSLPSIPSLSSLRTALMCCRRRI